MKTYLEVPHSESGEAKAKGARFDMSRKQWYCPDGVDLAKFKKWLPPKFAKFWKKADRKGRPF